MLSLLGSVSSSAGEILVGSELSTNIGLLYSENHGVSWSQSNITSGIFKIIAKGGLFYAFGTLSTYNAYYSSDGKTWTILTGTYLGCDAVCTNGTTIYVAKNQYVQSLTSTTISTIYTGSESSTVEGIAVSSGYIIKTHNRTGINMYYEYSTNGGTSFAGVVFGAGRMRSIIYTNSKFYAQITGDSDAFVSLNTISSGTYTTLYAFGPDINSDIILKYYNGTIITSTNSITTWGARYTTDYFSSVTAITGTTATNIIPFGVTYQSGYWYLSVYNSTTATYDIWKVSSDFSNIEVFSDVVTDYMYLCSQDMENVNS